MHQPFLFHSFMRVCVFPTIVVFEHPPSITVLQCLNVCGPEDLPGSIMGSGRSQVSRFQNVKEVFFVKLCTI